MAKATTSKDSVDRKFKRILRAVIADKPNADESLWRIFRARLQRIGQFKIDRLGYRGILNAEDVANEILYKFIWRVRLGKYGWVRSERTFVAVAFLIADDVLRRAKSKEHQHLIHQTNPLCSADVIKSFLSKHPTKMNSVKGEGKAGLTLIEVLVATTVVGLLFALLIPAVQMAREASRRSKCLNNLRQIALGVAFYEASHKTFPQSQNQHGSFLVTLLPFLEQAELAKEVGTFIQRESPSREFKFVHVLYLCPSDGVPSLVGEGGRIAGSNYCGNSGSWVVSAKRFDGIFRSFDDVGFGAGAVRIQDVSDGLSHTGCLSEWLRADSTFDRIRASWNTPRAYPNTREEFARDCRSIPQNPSLYGWQGNPHINGTPWFDGNLMVTLYNHVCVPNSPSCFNKKSVPTGAASVSSNHAGSCNVSFADGRVQSVDNEIDSEIWFAFGSRDGGDSHSFDL